MYLPVTEIMAVFSFLKKKKVGSKLSYCKATRTSKNAGGNRMLILMSLN